MSKHIDPISGKHTIIKLFITIGDFCLLIGAFVFAVYSIWHHQWANLFIALIYMEVMKR